MEISTLRKVELSGCFGWMLEKVSLKMRESMGGVIVFREITWKSAANGSRGTGHGDRENSPSLWRSLRASIERHTSNIQIQEEQSYRLARAINYLSPLLVIITPTVFPNFQPQGKLPCLWPGARGERACVLFNDRLCSSSVQPPLANHRFEANTVALSVAHLAYHRLQITDFRLAQWHYPLLELSNLLANI